MKSIVSLTLVVACTALLAVGCASNDKVASADKASKTCERTYRTGSNMPIKDCQEAMSDADRDDMLRQTRDALRTSQPGKPGS